MTFYNNIEYEGETWKYVYIDSDPSLDDEITKSVLWNIVDMHRNEEVRMRYVREDNFFAEICLKDHKTIGMLTGKYFEVDLDTDYGSSRLAILLQERVPKNKLN